MLSHNKKKLEAIIFNVQRFSLHDGPGIRTTVFFKGCPLRCLWCCNPESQNILPQLGFIRDRCNKCSKCIKVCPVNALNYSREGELTLDRSRCDACGKCIGECYSEALAIYGKQYHIDELFEQVRRDVKYYSTSGGGLTASGGEVMQQAPVVVELFRRCSEAGISTCIETSGYADPVSLQEVAKLTDIALYDLKHMNPTKHQRLTGRSNERILANAQLLLETGVRVMFRMPLIPGLNSGAGNIEETAKFIRDLQGENASLELMPYHPLGSSKYTALGMLNPLQELLSPEPEYADAVASQFEQLGVACSVSR